MSEGKIGKNDPADKNNGPPKQEGVEQESAEKNAEQRLLDVAKRYDISPKQLEAIIDSEKHRSAAPSIDLSEHIKDGKVKFGVLSDTRINSKDMRPDIYRSLYARFKEEGVSYVFHCGDITDGFMRYEGHNEDIIFLSYDKMLSTFFSKSKKRTENYPNIRAKTYFIGGNSDKSYFKRKVHDEETGYEYKTDVCSDISLRRPDLVFVGWNCATIKIAPKTTVRLSHPLPSLGSKKPYTISYPLQKNVNAFGGGQKPNILLSGFYQKRFSFEAREVNVQMIGSCISQTSHDTEQSISAPSLGGVIFEAYFRSDGSLEELVALDIPFYD